LLDKSIRKLGEYIRSQVEIWTKDNSDVDKWNLAGACAIASYSMYRALIKLGYNPKFIVADSGCGCHCWVEIDSYVIDLTATQFNMTLPKVLISNKNSYFKAIPELKSYYEVKVNRNAVKSTRTWDQQSPIIYTKEIRKIIRNLNEQDFR
jgi:hypothetical protein